MATAEKLRNLADCSSIELKVISCKDLKAFNFFQKLPVYAAVSIFNDEMKKEEQQKHLQLQKTPVDKEGVGNPEWNHTVQFDMKRLSLVDKFDHLFIKFDMRCEGLIFGEKSLGKVQAPFSDLIDDQFTKAVRFVSYQIRTSDGKANGVLNFSYKVIRNNNNNNKNNNRSSISSSRSSNIGNHDSSESDSSSELTIAPVDSADKVQSLYPTLEVENLSRDISYPSLVDVTTPLPRIPVPSAKFDFQWRPESSNISLPPVLPFSAPAAAPASVCCHQWQHLPFVQSPGAHWYPPEFANHGGIFCGNNRAGAGQIGMEFDHNDSWRFNSPGKRRDVLPHLGTSTNSGCS